jgi:hypothetical protein
MNRFRLCATGLRHWKFTGAVARQPVAGKVCASAPLARPKPSCPLGDMGQWRSGAKRTGGAAAQLNIPVLGCQSHFSGAALAQITTRAAP